jgi:hypothetical protein
MIHLCCLTCHGPQLGALSAKLHCAACAGHALAPSCTVLRVLGMRALHTSTSQLCGQRQQQHSNRVDACDAVLDRHACWHICVCAGVFTQLLLVYMRVVHIHANSSWRAEQPAVQHRNLDCRKPWAGQPALQLCVCVCVCVCVCLLCTAM